jgi:hypothetical protein
VQGLIKNGKVFQKNFKTQKHIKEKNTFVPGESISNLEEIVSQVLKEDLLDE